MTTNIEARQTRSIKMLTSVGPLPMTSNYVSLFASGHTIDQLANHFGRQPSAIESRLAKLGLIESNSSQNPQQNPQN